MSMVVACAGYQDGRRVANLESRDAGRFSTGRDASSGSASTSRARNCCARYNDSLGCMILPSRTRFAHQRPKVDVYGDAIFMVLRTARLIDAEIEFGETHVFAGKGYIISVRHGATSSYKEVRDRCESTPRMLENGEDYVLYAIMDFVVDNYMPIVDAIQYMPIVDAIQRQVEEIEDAVQQGAGTLGPNTIRRIAALRRDLLMGQRNPGGRPKTRTDLRELARAGAGEAIGVLVAVMNDRKAAPAARIAAATALLDRGHGRPAQTVYQHDTHASIDELSDEELIAIACGEADADDPGPEGSVH
jgi:hypothetical protein